MDKKSAPNAFDRNCRWFANLAVGNQNRSAIGNWICRRPGGRPPAKPGYRMPGPVDHSRAAVWFLLQRYPTQGRIRSPPGLPSYPNNLPRAVDVSQPLNSCPLHFLRDLLLKPVCAWFHRRHSLLRWFWPSYSVNHSQGLIPSGR